MRYFLLLICFWNFLQEPPENNIPTLIKPIKNWQTTIVDEAGRVIGIIKASEAAQMENKVYHITDIKAEVYPKSKDAEKQIKKIDLRAKKGIFYHDKNIITLSEDIKVVADDGSSISCQEISLDMKTGIYKVNSRFVLKGANLYFDGENLEADANFTNIKIQKDISFDFTSQQLNVSGLCKGPAVIIRERETNYAKLVLQNFVNLTRKDPQTQTSIQANSVEICFRYPQELKEYRISKSVLTGEVKIKDTSGISAMADSVIYQEDEQRIYLSGSPCEVSYGSNIIESKQLCVDIKDAIIISEESVIIKTYFQQEPPHEVRITGSSFSMNFVVENGVWQPLNMKITKDVHIAGLREGTSGICDRFSFDVVAQKAFLMSDKFVEIRGEKLYIKSAQINIDVEEQKMLLVGLNSIEFQGLSLVSNEPVTYDSKNQRLWLTGDVRIATADYAISAKDVVIYLQNEEPERVQVRRGVVIYIKKDRQFVVGEKLAHHIKDNKSVITDPQQVSVIRKGFVLKTDKLTVDLKNGAVMAQRQNNRSKIILKD